MNDLEKRLLEDGYVIEIRMCQSRVSCKIGVENGRLIKWLGVGFGRTKEEAIERCSISLSHATKKATR